MEVAPASFITSSLRLPRSTAPNTVSGIPIPRCPHSWACPRLQPPCSGPGWVRGGWRGRLLAGAEPGFPIEWLHLVLVLSPVGQRDPGPGWVLASGRGGQAEDLGQARTCSAARLLRVTPSKSPSSALRDLYPCRHHGVAESWCRGSLSFS